MTSTILIETVKWGMPVYTLKNKNVEGFSALNRNSSLKDRFNTLSPARKREYAEHVGSAKRAETRHQRLEMFIPLILSGTGLNDRYRK